MGSSKASIRAVVLSPGCISESLGAAFKKKKMTVPGFYPNELNQNLLRIGPRHWVLFKDSVVDSNVQVRL